MTLLDNRPGLSLDEARSALAREWEARGPRSPSEVLDFYQHAEGIAADLDAWHQEPERQKWTEIVAYAANQIGAKVAIDIGCGAGYELAALRTANPSLHLYGVEPNDKLRASCSNLGVISKDVAETPVEDADLLVCIDVLEHIPDPETFLAGIASRAKPNCILIESTATHDVSTPLHLKANRGWHPGHCLESLGWEVVDSHKERLRVWQRKAPKAVLRASVLLCAYRACNIPTMASLLKLQQAGWRIFPKWGDGYIPRVRGQITSEWWRSTADDVFLMVDDDITFEPAMAEKLVAECRDGHDIICAAYSVRDGGHLAIRSLDDLELRMRFGPDLPPVEIRYAATGFMAVHRRVIDALVETLPLCHQNQAWAYWPMFTGFTVEEPDPVGYADLSEDWAFCQRARDLGFKVWLDPTIRLGHQGQVEFTIDNMDAIHVALKGGK